MLKKIWALVTCLELVHGLETWHLGSLGLKELVFLPISCSLIYAVYTHRSQALKMLVLKVLKFSATSWKKIHDVCRKLKKEKTGQNKKCSLVFLSKKSFFSQKKRSPNCFSQQTSTNQISNWPKNRNNKSFFLFAKNRNPRLGGQELDLGIGIVRLHQAGGMHLDPLQIDALGANGFLGELCDRLSPAAGFFSQGKVNLWSLFVRDFTNSWKVKEKT